MRLIRSVLVLTLLLAGCASQQEPSGISVIRTLANYKTETTIVVRGGVTDSGTPLGLGGVLRSASNPYLGATSGGLGKEKELPEWIEIQWKEVRPELDISSREYDALDNTERKEHGRKYAAIPMKSARVAIRGRIPISVIEELKRTPSDRERSGLPLKALWVYFIWTKEGLKMRWEVVEKCCKVIHEGGDPIDYIRTRSTGPSPVS